MKNIVCRVNRLFIAIIIFLGTFLSFYPHFRVGMGILVILYGLFLSTQSVKVKENGVYYKSLFSSKALVNIEYVEISDVLFLNNVTFVSVSGAKLSISNLDKIEALKSFTKKINSKLTN